MNSQAYCRWKSGRKARVMSLPLVVRLLLLFTLCSSPNLFAAPVKLLVKNARLITMAPQQRDPFTGYLAVAGDGTIVAVAKGDPPADLKADQVLDAHGDWIIPGFISAHSHLWQAAYRGVAADKTLIDWIDDLYSQRAIKSPPKTSTGSVFLARSTTFNTGLPRPITSTTAERTSRAVLLMRRSSAQS